jgi:hypothetical protein
MKGPLDHRDLDYFPPGQPFPLRNARFELIQFDKISFTTTSAYLVKGIVSRVGLCVFWGPPKSLRDDLRSPRALIWRPWT